MAGEKHGTTSGGLVKTVQQAGAIAFFILGGFILWDASHFRYLTAIGPGPGFFPVWVGGFLVVLSAGLFIQASTSEATFADEEFVPDRDGIRRVLSTLVALVLFVWALERIGYSPTAFAFSFVLLIIFGRTRIVISLALSVLVSVVLFYIFNHLLGVRLPSSPLGLWPAIGI